MIPRSILRPLYKFHHRIHVLIVTFSLLCVLLIALLGYLLFTRLHNNAGVSTRLIPPQEQAVTLDPVEKGYDLNVVRNMYSSLLKGKRFIGEGLYVVIWDKNNHTFYDALTQNVDTPYNAASMTKLMTALTLAQEGVLPNSLVASGSGEEFDSLPEGEASGDFRGQTFPQHDLVAAMLIQSSNQAAYSLVRPIGQSTFMEKANKMARKLGMSRSVFRDPSGFDFSSKKRASYMSPRDVARVAFELVSQYPDLIRLSSNAEYDITNTRGKKFTLHNTNPLVQKTDKVLLSKTGYTNLAGGNLIMVTEPREGILVAYVTMHSTKEGRFSDMKSLTDTMGSVFDVYDLLRDR